MKLTTAFRFRKTLGISAAVCLLLSAIGGHARAAGDTPDTAEALIYSTMPSTAAHSPQMAMDGDDGTYFKSVYNMDDGDDFLVLLSHPIPVQSLKITTGTADGDDVLADGFVETSSDGVHFSRAAAFGSDGIASALLHNAPVEAVKIRVGREGVPSLVIREISLQSTTKITHVQMGPGRGFYDISQAPDLAVWAAKAEAQMEAFWPDTAALLYTRDFITPNMVNVVYRTGPGVTDVAATGGGVMTVNSKWCRAHPEDTGLTVHETAHVIQAMPAYNPVWLIEGTADYIRWVRFEPQNFTYRITPGKSTYHDAYRTTAAFLGWCELHYDSRLVTKLNQAVREGNYNNDMFLKYCGKDVDTLWSEFLKAYEADPKGVLTVPVPPADRPRILPVVKDGSSVPVDLSSAFNSVGFFNDGATYAQNSGTDGEGFAYSGTLLGASQTWKGVLFKLGPAGANDTITSHGATIALPPGNHASLWLLGSAVEGSQKAQAFTVTYTDGSTQALVQNMSDWFQPENFPGESRAVKMPYRVTASGDKDPRPFYVYSYGFAIDPTKSVKSLTLPENEDVKILAATLAD
jgi:hypothetical protein